MLDEKKIFSLTDRPFCFIMILPWTAAAAVYYTLKKTCLPVATNHLLREELSGRAIAKVDLDDSTNGVHTTGV